MSKKMEQIGIRLETSMRDELEVISEVEHVGIPELIRGWIRDKIAEYQKDRRYLARRQERETA